MVETQRFLRENLDSLTVGLFAQQIHNQGAKRDLLNLFPFAQGAQNCVG